MKVLDESSDGEVDLRLGEALPRAPPHPGAVGDDLSPALVLTLTVQQSLRSELLAVTAPGPGLVVDLADVGDDDGVGRDDEAVQLHLLTGPVLDPQRDVRGDPVDLVNEGPGQGSVLLVRHAGQPLPPHHPVQLSLEVALDLRLSQQEDDGPEQEGGAGL